MSGVWVVRASATTPIVRRLLASESGDLVRRAILDSEKSGEEAGDQTGGFIESFFRYILQCLMIIRLVLS